LLLFCACRSPPAVGSEGSTLSLVEATSGRAPRAVLATRTEVSSKSGSDGRFWHTTRGTVTSRQVAVQDNSDTPGTPSELAAERAAPRHGARPARWIHVSEAPWPARAAPAGGEGRRCEGGRRGAVGDDGTSLGRSAGSGTSRRRTGREATRKR